MLQHVRQCPICTAVLATIQMSVTNSSTKFTRCIL